MQPQVNLLARIATLHRPLVIAAAAVAALGVVAAGGLVIDDRQLLNQPIWTKTFKFSISFALYTMTLAWMISLMPKARRWGWWMGTLVAVGLGGDIMLMVIQMIGRGRRLHFNQADETDRLIHNLLATGAYGAFVATAVIAVLLSCQRLADKSLGSAIRAGLGVALAGMAMATLMFTPTPEQQAIRDSGHKSQIMGSHGVGVPDDAAGLPIVGWSVDGGDLRVAHFVGLHAVQLIPLLAIGLLALARRQQALRSSLVRRNLIRVTATGHLGLVAVLTWQAQRGQSVVHPDGATVLALTGLAALVGGGVWAALRLTPQPRDTPPGTSSPPVPEVTTTTAGNI